MATYKGIQGYTVQKLASDPTAADVEGQLWYNSSLGKFKISAGGAGTWSSGGSMVVGRTRTGGTGTSAAALCVGGYPPPSGGAAEVEEYNGSTWSEVTNFPAGNFSCGMAGSQTAALWISGDLGASPGGSESYLYNGASWTATGNRNDPAGGAAIIIRCQGCGTQGAALTTGGETTPWPTGNYVNVTESFNGSVWSEENAYPLNTSEVQLMGTEGAALGAGGYPGAPAEKLVNEWDGTSWSAGTNMSNGRSEFGSSHFGATQTSCMVFGGPPFSNKTELWNGTSWTEVAIMATGRNALGSGGSITNAIAFGGTTGSTTGATEAYDNAPISIKTVTVS